MSENQTFANKKRVGGTHVSAYLLLRQKDKVCLLLRKNTGYCDGQYGLISGHVEDGESATEGMIREAYEEAGLILAPDQLKVIHTMHRKTERLGIDIFFECLYWTGPVKNQEPDKCERIDFFPLDNLPANIMAYVRTAIQAIAQGQIYSEIGWS